MCTHYVDRFDGLMHGCGCFRCCHVSVLELAGLHKNDWMDYDLVKRYDLGFSVFLPERAELHATCSTVAETMRSDCLRGW